MNYFFANLATHGLLCIFLIVLMVIFTNRNFKRKTKHALTYFLPVLLLIIIGFDVFRYLAPRLFDINNVLGNVTYTYTGKVESVSAFKNYFVIDGKTYYINPMRGDVEVGSTIRIKYTPTSNYVIKISKNIDASED